MSPYGNHGTITGATWERLSSGVFVLSYNGISNYVEVGSSSILDSLGESTFLGWAKLTDVAAGVNTQWMHTNDATFRLGPIGSTWGNVNDINIGGVDFTGAAYNTRWGVWTLLTYVFSESTNTLQQWENATKGYENLAWEGTVPVLGAENLYYGSSGLQCKGLRALGRIFNRALSSTEIVGIFQSERHLFGV
jgi:hypothetical protein